MADNESSTSELEKTTPSPPKNNTIGSASGRYPNSQFIGIRASDRQMTPQNLLKTLSRLSTPEENYQTPLQQPPSSTKSNANASQMTGNDDPFTAPQDAGQKPVVVKSRMIATTESENNPTPTRSVGGLVSTASLDDLIDANNHMSFSAATKSNLASSQLPTIHRRLPKPLHNSNTSNTATNHTPTPSATSTPIQPQKSPRQSQQQQSANQSLVEGNSGGFYSSQGQPILDFSTIVENEEELRDDSSNVTKTPVNEQEVLEVVRLKLGNALSKKVPAVNDIVKSDLADEIYLEVRESLKELKDVVREIKRKQDSTMIEQETIKDGLYDLIDARKQFQEIQGSIDEVQNTIKEAEAEFAAHRTTLEERRREDDILEIQVKELDAKTLKLAQIIEDKRREQQQLSSQQPPPLIIRVLRELNELRSKFASLIGLFILFLLAEFVFIYLLMISRREELETRLGLTHNLSGSKDADGQGVWVIPMLQSVLNFVSSVFFADERYQTPV
ncbi:hypothetical protein SmJEL517_g02963 [Synchytrium microbalum]|uniref:Uncharacterized protein n=1 Tax=Synchytrium microbalum TaxID=1806994 RepID=A0A507C4M6_9FUNG|nr:uncharacterized protein SmJEL517_g02963 [Synchytrium microbalum]TPX34348.1 hypothetical protein SmJEL517_g02963 [Synchytrium microbalum]